MHNPYRLFFCLELSAAPVQPRIKIQTKNAIPATVARIPTSLARPMKKVVQPSMEPAATLDQRRHRGGQ